jgi:putative transposase
MELKVSVSEALTLIKEVEGVSAKIFEYIGVSIQEAVGSFLTNLMEQELTHHLGRDKYEQKEGQTDYRNGSYTRTFCMKGVGDVELKIPRDRDGDFTSQVIPRSKQYDDRITEDVAAMYLTGISTRLGLTYNLVTAFKSFVAMDTEVRNKEGQPWSNSPYPCPRVIQNMQWVA